jgi:pSer/pThr/pTyr-binding forkhead associated (FHA) protein
MYKLSHIIAGKVIHKYALREGVVRIGRSPDNDICLNDKAVSGHHLQIFITPSTSMLGDNIYMSDIMDVIAQDMDSTNGTLINGHDISQHMLKDGDVIKIGGHEFRYTEE